MSENRIRLRLIDSVQNFKGYFQSSVGKLRHAFNRPLELLCWVKTSISRVNTLLKKPGLIYITGGYGLCLPLQLAMDEEYPLCLGCQNSTTASLMHNALIRESRANNRTLHQLWPGDLLLDASSLYSSPSVTSF